MKSRRILLLGSIVLPILFAISSSTAMWPDVSLAAKIAFFAYGVWTGAAIGAWALSRREAAIRS